MITLDRLVNVLGGSGVRLWGGARRPREVMLRSVVVHDPTDSRSAAGDVYLAIGLDAAAAIAAAERARAVAVLVRDGETVDAGTIQLAERSGLALVTVDVSTSWSHLSGLVFGLVLEGRETESGRGPTDLFALADSLAAAAGGAVVIEDQLCRVLAYSNLESESDQVRLETIMGRRPPESVRTLFEARGVYRHLAVSDEPLFVEPDVARGFRGRVAIAIRAGRELLGSLWVETGGPLTGGSRQAIVDGAHICALHLLRSRASADLERQVESDLVMSALEGAVDARALTSQLGLPGENLRVIALQAHVEDERHAAVLLAFEKATIGFGWSRQSRSALFGNTVYTVMPEMDALATRSRSWTRGILGELPPTVLVTAGVGGPADAAGLPTSRQEADESLALHAARGGVAPMVYDESWDQILLHRLRVLAASGRTPARSPATVLRRHDAEFRTDYADTLRTWLECNRDTSAAAAGLAVHPNTVRYRLRRIREVVDLDLDAPEQRLAALIAFAATAPDPLVLNGQSTG
jgi:hypothetical protein